MDLNKLLSENTYPGRGIVIGRNEDDIVIAYFIMGRSENSRNRVFITDGEGIKTKAFDESKLTDPSLIIYSPVRVLGDNTIVTNGDQTDTVYDFMKDGKTFADALRTRQFEPDAPNFTPRISGVVNNKTGDYKLSILKTDNGVRSLRYFFEYNDTISGLGHFIHTYQGDGNPIPSFAGEPEEVLIKGDIDTFTNDVWENLNKDNKVSLFTRFINIKTGEVKTRIINKNK
ncbi:MAG: IMP cyclohydrolase [Oscillospiraceae bacterium]